MKTIMSREKRFQYIYGPVYSWRLGMSLGIDPISTPRKICNFDCVYCQLGRTALPANTRREFVRVEDLIEEIRQVPFAGIDHYTFSGRGEPTLARNLGAMIRAVKTETGGAVAVITDSVLMSRPEVREDLREADVVLAKLDACDQASLEAVDVPVPGIRFEEIVEGLKAFRREYSGRLALQMMFVEANAPLAADLAVLAASLSPDEIQLNTPLRPGGQPPLSERGMRRIKRCFKGLPAVTVYEMEKRTVQPFDEQDTIRRHGNFKKNAASS